MRTLILSLFIVLSCLLAADVAGDYKGTWTGAATGEFRMSLTSGGNGEMSGNVVFTMGNDEVKTKVTSVKVDGNKLDMTYQFDLQGTELQSKIVGELKGKSFEGAYKTTTVADGSPVDEGTWKASAR